MAKAGPKLGVEASRKRVRRHRAALRADGLRPLQIWIPDTRRPGFQDEIDRQCKALAISFADTADPEFETEYRREMSLIAEHDRASGHAARIEPDTEDLNG